MLRVAIILVALAFGGLAGWIVVSQRGSPQLAGSEVAAPIPTTEVLVAASDVPSGAALIAENLTWQPWPSNAVGPSFITRAARPSAKTDMVGMIVRAGLVAGEPVYESRLLGNGAGFLSVMLAPGMRAVAVKVNAETTAGGFILPNDHVDVMHTYTAKDGVGSGKIISEVLLRNVRVLAIDQMAAKQGSDSLIGKTATLELYADQVEAITAAAASGEISLVLRPVADNAELSQAQPKPQPVEPTATPAPPSRTISIYRANGLERLKINDDAAATALSQ